MAKSTGHEYDGITAYLEGDFRPLADAKVSVMTHAFLYGTATFEGIRAYWNRFALLPCVVALSLCRRTLSRCRYVIRGG